MKKRFAAGILSAAVVFLCGCGSVFDGEYVSVSDYVPTVQENGKEEGKVTVRNLTQLKQALRELVASGEKEGSIQFDSAYDGEATEDMAAACWQVRSQDALCAYCVENISYELSKIVTYYEAKVSVNYSRDIQQEGSMVRLPYSTGVEDSIRTALEQGKTRLVVLIGSSTYSAEEMELLVGKVYRSNPAGATREPHVNVNMLSGTSLQRLYEINLNYGVSSGELQMRQKALKELQAFPDGTLEEQDSAHRVLAICDYLREHCTYSDNGENNDVYAALIQKTANSEGLALACVELCHQQGIDCQIVYGQRNWQNHCWDIVNVEGEYYHVDPTVCLTEGLERGFLLSDEAIWNSHRCDTSAYPRCTGKLNYASLSADLENNT